VSRQAAISKKDLDGAEAKVRKTRCLVPLHKWESGKH